MSYVKERFSPVVCPVNTATPFGGDSIGGFLAVTTGTLTIVNSAGVTIVAAVPVTAGVYTPMPFYIGTQGGTATTAGGASGTLST